MPLTRGQTGSSSPLLRRPAPDGGSGVVHAIDPADAGWTWISFDVRRLAAGQGYSRSGDTAEVLVLVLEGTARVTAGDDDFGALGTRASVFDGPPPPVVLVAPGRDVAVTAAKRALVAIAAAPGGAVERTTVFGPTEVLVETRGRGNTERRIHHLLPPAVDAGRLIAYEVFTPAGNWSSYPPHKHDTEDPPREAQLEELYLYRFARPEGFAIQRVYTADRELDETIVASDLDLVLVPRGYHMVGAPAGYVCYYLNIMAGPSRAWHFTVDPDHAWLMDWDPATPQTTR